MLANRHCPKCQSTARDKWLDRTAQELLPVPYSHVIFTLPGTLSPLALQNPRLIYSLLVSLCFRNTATALPAIQAGWAPSLGFLAVLHTWNQKMLTHTHLHCLVPSGGLAPDESRWVHSRKRLFLPGPGPSEACFRGKFLALLAATFRQKRLLLLGPLQTLQRPETFDRLLRSLRKLKWVVEVRPPLDGWSPTPASAHRPLLS